MAAIAGRTYLQKSQDDIRGSGYCVDSLEAAVWCFAMTESFRDAVLAAANLGDDADTTAAIVGQLAGAFYGADSIPAGWIDTLHQAAEIRTLACALAVARAAQK